MNYSHLVPTPTVDKNGRQTTVYRRVEAPAQSTGIPAPMVKGRNVPVSEDMVNAISSIFMFEEGSYEEDEMRHVLQNLSPSFRETLALVLEDDDFDFVTAIASNIHSESTEPFLNECIRFIRETCLTNMDRSASMVRALHHYLVFGEYRDLTKAPEEVQESACRLLRVTAALEELYEEPMTSLRYVELSNGTDAPMLADEKMIELVAYDADASERILDIIETHRVKDANVIFGIMDGVEASLAEGSL